MYNVWCVKYRHKILVGNIKDDFIDIITNICKNNNYELVEINTDLDHVYLLIGLLVFTAILGKMKMEKKNIQDWGIVNLILLVMICISLISLLSCFIHALGGSIFELLNSGKILIIPFYLCLCFIFFTILFL